MQCKILPGVAAQHGQANVQMRALYWVCPSGPTISVGTTARLLVNSCTRFLVRGAENADFCAGVRDTSLLHDTACGTNMVEMGMRKDEVDHVRRLATEKRDSRVCEARAGAVRLAEAAVRVWLVQHDHVAHIHGDETNVADVAD